MHPVPASGVDLGQRLQKQGDCPMTSERPPLDQLVAGLSPRASTGFRRAQERLTFMGLARLPLALITPRPGVDIRRTVLFETVIAGYRRKVYIEAGRNYVVDLTRVTVQQIEDVGFDLDQELEVSIPAAAQVASMQQVVCPFVFNKGGGELRHMPVKRPEGPYWVASACNIALPSIPKGLSRPCQHVWAQFILRAILCEGWWPANPNLPGGPYGERVAVGIHGFEGEVWSMPPGETGHPGAEYIGGECSCC